MKTAKESMDRDRAIREIRSSREPWDILVIGGGATGMGTALDAASRGFRTLLLEQHDFGKGTSSRSTKLVHGGVRYLRQGDVSLVIEALRERGLMLRNAPQLVRNLSFVIPVYDWWEGPFYTVGMKVYDMMAGRMGLGPSRSISREETMAALPNIETRGLKGGIVYHDGQFDDARMLISMARTCRNYGAWPVNYLKVTGLIRKNNLVAGVTARDEESGETMNIPARVVVNATGVFADEILRLDSPAANPMIRPSQGIHLVLDKSFLSGPNAIMVPSTSDGRVMFAVPWYNRVVLGTTDTLIPRASLEPRPLEEEIKFVLGTAGQYLVRKPERVDVRSAFAGLRPLAAPESEGKATREISRHHKVMVSVSGLVSVIGGKWTTYRKMAEDAVDYAIMTGGLPERPCLTRDIRIHGYDPGVSDSESPMHVYGSERFEVEGMNIEDRNAGPSGGESIGKSGGESTGKSGGKSGGESTGKSAGNESPGGAMSDSGIGEFLSKSLNIRKSQVIWAARNEMARTLEDVLARRTRALFLDARESMAIAPEAARLLAAELGRDGIWIREQLDQYGSVARGYLVESDNPDTR